MPRDVKPAALTDKSLITYGVMSILSIDIYIYIYIYNFNKTKSSLKDSISTGCEQIQAVNNMTLYDRP